MVAALRVRLDPVSSGDVAERVHVSTFRIGLTSFGAGRSRARLNEPQPAKLILFAAYLQRVRRDAPREPKAFAHFPGQILLQNPERRPRFVLNAAADTLEVQLEYSEPLEQQLELEKGQKPRRVLQVMFDPASFELPPQVASPLLVLPDEGPEAVHYLELFGELEIAGTVEAPKEANAPLDVPIVRSRDFPLPAQKPIAVHGLELEQEPIVLAQTEGASSGDTATDAGPPPLAIDKPRVVVFSEGPPTKPSIRHDHGFLDDGNGDVDESKKRAPTASDRVALATWVARLRGAQLLRVDLKDATDAYENYLFGKGKEFRFNYQKFVAQDRSGKIVLDSLIQDVVAGAIHIHDTKMISTPASDRGDAFSMVSGAVPVGGEDLRYPYPATENWQKAIGGHVIWVEAEVRVLIEPALSRREFDVTFTLHAEDMYNFNPQDEDIATGIPDSENGRFQQCELAHEFLSTSVMGRTLRFSAPLAPSVDPRTLPLDLVVALPPTVPKVPGRPPPQP